MIGTLGWQELLIIRVILALLFGASRVADLGGALGKGIREFRSEAQKDGEEEGEEGAEQSGGETAASKVSKSEESESSG